MISWGKKVLIQEIPLPTASSLLSLWPCIVLKYHPHHSTKYEGKGTKISIFKLFSELGMKIWKCNQGFSKIPFMNWEKLGNIHSSRSTFQNPNIESMDGNSYKRAWPHFKLNIINWGISFPKMLRICQWIGKNIFHWGKWNEPIKLIKECVRLKIKT